MRRSIVPAVTVFLSAALLFAIQPMAAKRVLPWFGGGAAVWTTALLLFQSLLLIGYAYAHGLTRLPRRTAAVVHGVLLLLATTLVLTRGVLPTDASKPAGDVTQARVLFTLTAAVGLPYGLLSATAPLVQAWRGGGRGSYRLYALSNAGSLLTLVGYPLLVEPWTDLSAQGRAWAWVFAFFAAMCGLSLWFPLPVFRGRAREGVFGWTNDSGPRQTPFSSLPRGTGIGGRTPLIDRLLWVALPACATAALLAITNHLSQDVAPVPLLWVAPLAAYLLSYVLAFAGDRWTPRRPWAVALGLLAAAAAVGGWPTVRPPFAVVSLIDLALLLAIGMVCHGEVARRRPATADATAFYFSLSAGGAIGGLLVAVVAPRVFKDFYELPIVLTAAWAAALLTWPRPDGRLTRTFTWTAAALITLLLTLLAWAPFTAARVASIAGDRDFFGVFNVQEGDLRPGTRLRRMMHGHISHGAQFVDPARRREPVQYYDATSGIGRLMAGLAGRPKRVAVVGLGTGTLAAFAEHSDEIAFAEISPVVIGLAEQYFTYLSDARDRGARVTVRSGDGRLLLERDAAGPLDLLVLDAFSGDAVPVHLLTREAFALYRRRLGPDGVLAVNVTNHNVDLLPVLAATATELGVDLRVVRSTPDPDRAVFASAWAMLFFGDAVRVGDVPAAPTPVVWTDERSSLLPVLKWK